MTRVRQRLIAGLLLAFVLSAAAALIAERAGVLDGLEQRATSARFAVRGPAPPDDIVIVAIDDNTFTELHPPRQWPFPRSLHATAIDRLHAAGADTIAYDVQFTEPTDPREDGALFESLKRSGGAILATSQSDERGRTNVLGGDANLRRAHSRAAAVNLPASIGGTLERLPYANGALPSLAVVVARRAGGPRLSEFAFGRGGARIDFRGPPGTIPTIPFSSVVNGTFNPSLVRGRIVVVGASAASLQDVHPTPTANEPMAGPEIEANAIWTALHGLPLKDAPSGINFLLVLALAAIVPLLRLRLRVLAAALIGPLVAGCFVVGAQIAFEHGAVIWVAAPLAALSVSIVTMVVASHLAETAYRRRISRVNEVLEAKVQERTRELRESQLEILERLSRAAEGRDEETGLHVARIGQLSHRLAAAAGLDTHEAELIGHAAVAHDIGKISIPDRILLKEGPLDDGERHEMQRHALTGAAILSGSRSRVVQLAEEIARTHHERWDGSGYPHGLAGTRIPLSGRICAICDVFDALISERPYKKPWPLERTLDELSAQSGKHFDPALVDAFESIARDAYAVLYGPTQATIEAKRRQPAKKDAVP